MTPPRRRASDVDEVEHSRDDLSVILEKLDTMLVILEGRHDENGDHHPGLSHRVRRLENALNWIVGLATAVATIVAGWWTVHLGGGKP